MKEQLIQLAKEKEFDYHIPSIDHWGHPNEERWYYFYMCEVQKWLREKHEIYLAVVSINKQSHRYFYEEDCESIWPIWYKTYEEALEVGLYESLELIKS
jgi:hypothetical protein